ncbi:MAG: cupin domain-containing protein [archaeon]
MNKYRYLREAINEIQRKDREYVSVRHDLRAGKSVGPHFHPSVWEWAIFDSFGRAKVAVDFENKLINDPIGVLVVNFPKGHIHGLKCLTDVSYLVVREGDDDTVYLNDVLKRKSSVEPKEDPCGLLWELYNHKSLGIAYVEVTGTADEHKHRVMEEKYYVKKGRGKVVINNKALDVRKGDLIQIPQGSWHYLKKMKGNRLEVLVVTHPGYDPKDFILKS